MIKVINGVVGLLDDLDRQPLVGLDLLTEFFECHAHIGSAHRF